MSYNFKFIWREFVNDEAAEDIIKKSPYCNEYQTQCWFVLKTFQVGKFLELNEIQASTWASVAGVSMIVLPVAILCYKKKAKIIGIARSSLIRIGQGVYSKQQRMVQWIKSIALKKKVIKEVAIEPTTVEEQTSNDVSQEDNDDDFESGVDEPQAT